MRITHRRNFFFSLNHIHPFFLTSMFITLNALFNFYYTDFTVIVLGTIVLLSSISLSYCLSFQYWFATIFSQRKELCASQHCFSFFMALIWSHQTAVSSIADSSQLTLSHSFFHFQWNCEHFSKKLQLFVSIQAWNMI